MENLHHKYKTKKSAHIQAHLATPEYEQSLRSQKSFYFTNALKHTNHPLKLVDKNDGK